MKHEVQAQLELLSQQIKELIGIYRGAVGHAGISENEFWVWYTLIVLDGEYSQQDICNMWSQPKQTINTIISHMTRKGLVSLEVVPGTRNRKIIRLTEAGRKYGESIVLPISEAEQRTYDRIPQEERTACTAALSRFISILKEELYGTESKQP